MKCSAIIALALACGPAAIMAAPVATSTDPTTALLAVREEGAQPQASSQATPQGSSAMGSQGQKSGNEGILDKVEKILKDILGGLRKRGLVEEVGEALKKAMDGTSELVNGQQSGSQSSFASQSSNPDAETAQQTPKQSSDNNDSGSDSGSGSGVGKFLGGRNSPVDPITGAAGSAPAEAESLPNQTPSPLGAGTAPSSSASPQGGQDSELPSSASQLSPEQLDAILGILTGGPKPSPSGSGHQQQKTPQFPGQDE
ncbi:hypothetical protein BGW36DRAFT_356484 [Talaromyces proteolyticus]|uniref:Uncharacterized protein n=1 Tax=Talaromyces proteolyticus TaxID=1131652 RepID=A0AAD4L1X9_9EURO|nr:uncharacterized protein BGW36DRAFT_356484 [Talaromyces proteolyticus]KAH8702360.1 hypothetical protein BGW36DRAFT_356484 [Talaromyces proteolyticus]